MYTFVHRICSPNSCILAGVEDLRAEIRRDPKREASTIAAAGLFSSCEAWAPWLLGTSRSPQELPGQDFLVLLSGPMNKFYLLGCRSAFFQLVGKPMNVLIWLMYRIQAYGKAKALWLWELMKGILLIAWCITMAAKKKKACTERPPVGPIIASCDSCDFDSFLFMFSRTCLLCTVKGHFAKVMTTAMKTSPC